MKFTTKKIVSALSVAALVGASSVWAQEPAETAPPGASARSVMPGEAVPLPQVHTVGSASYVTGGTVYEELPAFQAARSQFPLNVEIYQKAGAKNQFTADVEVKLIAAGTGNVVIDAKSEGPFFWAKVPPGDYKLQTTMNGQLKESNVAVKSSGSTRAVVVFPQGAAQ